MNDKEVIAIQYRKISELEEEIKKVREEKNKLKDKIRKLEKEITIYQAYHTSFGVNYDSGEDYIFL